MATREPRKGAARILVRELKIFLLVFGIGAFMYLDTMEPNFRYPISFTPEISEIVNLVGLRMMLWGYPAVLGLRLIIKGLIALDELWLRRRRRRND